jgi:WD40 repeat protein
MATTDVEDIVWSPTGDAIAAWDTSLTYKVVVYTPAGHLVASYSAYDNAIGIRCMSWSPSGQLLSVGSYDQVRWMTALIAVKQNIAYLAKFQQDFPLDAQARKDSHRPPF